MVRPESVSIGTAPALRRTVTGRRQGPDQPRRIHGQPTRGSRSRPTPGSSSRIRFRESDEAGSRGGDGRSGGARLVGSTRIDGRRRRRRAGDPSEGSWRRSRGMTVLRSDPLTSQVPAGDRCRRGDRGARRRARRPATSSAAARRGRHVQLDDVERPLGSKRSSKAIRRTPTRSSTSDQRARGQRRGLRKAQGGQGPARHDVGATPCGCRNAYAKDGLIEPFDINELEGLDAALFRSPAKFAYLDDARGLPRLSRSAGPRS